jgi:hypothetical protein
MALFEVDPPGTVLVRVSVASAWQRFHGCTPEYIRDVCHARCCDAPSRPEGTLVTIHPSEEAAIRARGGDVADGRLVTPGRVCTFKTDASLCGLHGTGDKPFGCVASPFTLNRSDCLIVRNRYRRLVCYGQEPRLPAFVAFRASLDLIFGEDESGGVVRELEWWADHPGAPRFLHAHMPQRSYDILHWNDAAKKSPP